MDGVKIPVPPRYDGKTDVLEWIAVMTRYFRAAGLERDGDRFTFAAALLQGPAVFLADNVDSWSGLQERLKQKYGMSQIQARMELKLLKQNRTPIVDHIQKI